MPVETWGRTQGKWCCSLLHTEQFQLHFYMLETKSKWREIMKFTAYSPFGISFSPSILTAPERQSQSFNKQTVTHGLPVLFSLKRRRERHKEINIYSRITLHQIVEV